MLLVQYLHYTQLVMLREITTTLPTAVRVLPSALLMARNMRVN